MIVFRNAGHLWNVSKETKGDIQGIFRPRSVDELIKIVQTTKELKENGRKVLTPDGKELLTKLDRVLSWICPNNIIRISVVYEEGTNKINRDAMKAKIFTLNSIIMTNPITEKYNVNFYEDYSTLYLDSYRSQPYISSDNMGEEIAPIYSEEHFRKIPNQNWMLETKCSDWVQTKYSDKGFKIPPLKHYAKFYVFYIGEGAKVSNSKKKVEELPTVIINICKLLGVNPKDYTRKDLAEVLKFMLNNLKDYIDESLSLNYLKELYNIIPDSITLDNKKYIVKSITREVIIERYNSGLYPLDPDICCTFNVKTKKSDYSNVIDDDYNLYIENMGCDDGYIDSEEEEDE